MKGQSSSTTRARRATSSSSCGMPSIFTSRLVWVRRMWAVYWSSSIGISMPVSGSTWRSMICSTSRPTNSTPFWIRSMFSSSSVRLA
jgi:hypothetical protein